MSQKLNVKEACKDDTDRFGTAFCLSMVHTGVNKCLLNYAILENYETAFNAVGSYHQFITTSNLPGFEDVELKPPVEISVNKNNISVMEKAILDVYVQKEDSPYNILKKSPFWGIMHDGIVKAPGLDGIPAFLWKEPIFHEELLYFCNKTFEGNKPEAFSTSCLKPIPKTGDLGSTDNYWGISLTAITSKIYNYGSEQNIQVHRTYSETQPKWVQEGMIHFTPNTCDQKNHRRN